MTVRFSDCVLDVGTRELLRSGAQVAMEPQVFDVLTYLVEHRDRVVLKTELLDEIWGDRFVSESALTSRIKSARRAVGDTGREQRIIRTIHGRGFRFVATIEPNGDGRMMSTPERETGRGPTEVSADVLLSVTRRLSDGQGVAVELTGSSLHLAHLVDDIYEAAVSAGRLAGRGSGSGAGLRPFGCVVDAIDEMTQRTPELLERVPESCRVELRTVLGGQPPSIRARLFLGVRELLVAAAERGPTLLVVDELQYADADTIALLNQCARLTRRYPLAVVAVHGPGMELGEPYQPVVVTESVGEGQGKDDARPTVPLELVNVLQLVALEGSSFDAALVRAAAGDDDGTADRLLDWAIRAAIVEPVPSGRGYRFCTTGTADELVAELGPHRRAQLHGELADRLIAADAEPARVAFHLLAADEPKAALPYAMSAVRDANAAQRYPDVLRWTEAVLEHAADDDRRELLTWRAAALVGTGDPTATQVYRQALALARPGEATELRSGMARAAVLAGDLGTAVDAIAGIKGEDLHRPEVLLVRAMLAYFQGDLDAADELLDAARAGALTPGAPGQLLDVISLQGLIAHNRGEWFDRLRRELRTTRDSPDLAVSIFDSHLCVAEYLLYGPTRYEEVIELSTGLREQAEQSGARRAVAFAACLTGEARLLAGDLPGARRDLEESVELHRLLGADAGTAHSLQRLAEVELASGDPAVATHLLREAAVLARWSPLSRHLLQRTYGTLIAAAPDAQSALAVVEEADDVLDAPGSCEFCQVMVEVPAAIACAEVGRLEDAHRHLARATWSAGFWEGTAWRGAVLEAEAAIALAEDRATDADELLTRAASLFDQAGQPLDAARCRDTVDDRAD